MYGALFTIDQSTGVVAVGKSGGTALSSSSYNLSVEAVDTSTGTSTVPGITAIIIQVVAVNTVSPTITVDAMTGNGRPQVTSGSAVGSPVAVLSATDSDKGLNGEVAEFH